MIHEVTRHLLNIEGVLQHVRTYRNGKQLGTVIANTQSISMHMSGSLEDQFPEEQFLLRRLQQSDQDFAAACEDYCAAIAAERYWRDGNDPVKAADYNTIAAELRSEIAARLSSARTFPLDRSAP